MELYPLSFRATKETVDRLKTLEKKSGMSRSEVIRQLIDLAEVNDQGQLELHVVEYLRVVSEQVRAIAESISPSPSPSPEPPEEEQ